MLKTLNGFPMGADAMKKLVHAVQEISLARTLDAIMAIVRSAARELSGADGASFILRDEDRCYYADEDAIGPLWKGQRFPMKACVSGWCMMHREVVAIADIYADPRVPIDAYRPTFVKSLLMVPIRIRDPLGAIGVYWADPHTPTQDEKETLAALAQTVCVAIENVQLNADLERQIYDLEEANRAKDEFLMTISHELRTPLNSILGWSEILNNTQAQPDDFQLGLETILRNSEDLNRLISDLIDTSLVTTGRLSFEKMAIDPVSIIRSSVAAVVMAADAKNIRIEIQIKNMVGMVLGDALRLQQVLWNLLSNAIKFTPVEGRIVVSLERDNGTAKISVTDSGEGIDPGILPYIFDCFRQSNSSTIRKHGGLGLGLALARYLIEAHGGRIEALSEGPGCGSKFTIYIPLAAIALPRTPSPVQAAPTRENAAVSLAGWRVLVVDDVDDARLLVSFIVRNQGALVKELDGAQGVLDAIQEFQPHLLLCDLCMPGEDGYSLIRRIRSVGTGQELPAIAISAYTDQKSVDRAMNSGFDGVISKPVLPKKLVLTIMEICQHSKPHSGFATRIDGGHRNR